MTFFASLTSDMAERLTLEELDELTLDEAELVTGGGEPARNSALGSE